jgi:hypothetical protein
MATLKAIYNLLHGTPELKQRVEAARIKAAWNVVNEAPETANHTARKAWAESVIADSKATLGNEYIWFCSNATIQADPDGSTDDDVDYVVASFLNQWAEV